MIYESLRNVESFDQFYRTFLCKKKKKYIYRLKAVMFQDSDLWNLWIYLCEINFDFFMNSIFRTAVALFNIEHCYRFFEFDNCNCLIQFRILICEYNKTEKLHKFNYGNLSLFFRTEYL